MAKTTPVASKATRTRATRRPRKITASQANIGRAIKELGIDKPYYTVRVVGNRLEFSLHGGSVVYWPEAASRTKRSPRKGSPSRPKGGN